MKQTKKSISKQNYFMKHEQFLSEEVVLNRLFAAEPVPIEESESSLNVRERHESQDHIIKQIHSLRKRRPLAAKEIHWLVDDVQESAYNLQQMWITRGFSSTPGFKTSMIFPYMELIFKKSYIPNCSEVIRHFISGTTDLFIQRKSKDLHLHSNKQLSTRLCVLHYQLHCASSVDKIACIFKTMLLSWQSGKVAQAQGLFDFSKSVYDSFVSKLVTTFTRTALKESIDTLKQTVVSMYIVVKDKVLEFMKSVSHYIKDWWCVAVILISAILSSIVWFAFADRLTVRNVLLSLICGLVGAATIGMLIQQVVSRERVDTKIDVRKRIEQHYKHWNAMRFPSRPIESPVDGFVLLRNSQDPWCSGFQAYVYLIDREALLFAKDVPPDSTTTSEESAGEEENDSVDGDELNLHPIDPPPIVKKRKPLPRPVRTRIKPKAPDHPPVDPNVRIDFTENEPDLTSYARGASSDEERDPVDFDENDEPIVDLGDRDDLVFNLFAEEDEDGTIVNAQGGEDTLSLTMLSSLSHFMFGSQPKSTSGLMTPVREFNTLASGVKNVKEMLSTLFDAGYKVVDIVCEFATGKPFFTKSLEANMLIEVLTTQSEILSRENIRADMVNDKELCIKIREAYETLIRYRRTASGSDMRSMGFATELTRLITVYMPLYHEAMKVLMLHKTRPEPFWFYLFGLPGFGKTKFMEFFIPAVYQCLTKKKFAATMRYERKLDQEFWDGYANQWCTSVDDVFQILEPEARTTTTMELIHMINSNPFPLHMASLESKGFVSFESKFVITSTNELALPRALGINDQEALYRRIGLRVQLSTKTGQKFPTKTDAWSFPDDFEGWKFDVITPDGKRSAELTFQQLVNLTVKKLKQRELSAKQCHEAYASLDYSSCMQPRFSLSTSSVNALAQGAYVSRAQNINLDSLRPTQVMKAWVKANKPVNPWIATESMSQQALRYAHNRTLQQDILSPNETLWLTGCFPVLPGLYDWVQQNWSFCIRHYKCLISSLCYQYHGHSRVEQASTIRQATITAFCNAFQRYQDASAFFSQDWCDGAYQDDPHVYDYHGYHEACGLMFETSPFEFMTMEQIRAGGYLTAEVHRLLYRTNRNDDFVASEIPIIVYFDDLTDEHQRRFLRCLSSVVPNLSFHPDDEGNDMHPSRDSCEFTVSLWRAWYAFFDWFSTPQGIRVTVIGLIIGVLSLLAIFLVWLVSPRQLGVEAQSKDNYDTRDRAMSKINPFGKPVVYVDPHGVEVEPQTCDQGAAEIAIRAINNNVPCDIHYVDGTVLATHVQFIGGTMAVSSAHSFEFPHPIRMIELFKNQREDRGCVEQYVPHQVTIQIESSRDVAFLDFKTRLPTKSMKQHMPHVDSNLEAANPARIQFHRKLMVVSKGTHFSKGNVVTTSYPSPNGMIHKELYGSYRAQSVEGMPGLCGTPYVLFNPKVEKKFVGIHVAGFKGDSIVAPIYVEDFDRFLRPEAHYSLSEQVLAEGGFTMSPSVGESLSGAREVATISQSIFVPRDSRIVSSCFYDGVINPNGDVIPCYYPVLKAPAKLSPFRNDKGVLIKPLELALAKIGNKRIRPMDPELTHRDNYLGIRHPNFSKHKHRILTLEEAVNGLVSHDVSSISLSKSSGPGFAERGIKLDKLIRRSPFWIDPRLEKQVKEEIALVEQGFFPPGIASWCLKDETRPIDRVAAGATRAFAVMGKSHVLRSIMYLGTFKEALCSDPTQSDISLGINCHSAEWGMLHKRLCRFGPKTGFVALDTPAWDINFVVGLAWDVSREIAEMMCLDPIRDALWIRNIVCLVVTTLCSNFILHNKVFSCTLMPSGSWETSWLNSIVNSICFRFAFRKLCPGLKFDDWCALGVNGDDSALGVHPDVIDKFNGITISKLFKREFNWDITNPDKSPMDKKSIPREDLIFLQRKFREQGSCTFAPLELPSLYSMTQWIRSDEKPKKEQTIENLRTAISEFFHYGKVTFEFERARLNKVIQILDSSKVYTQSYEDLMAAYLQNAFLC